MNQKNFCFVFMRLPLKNLNEADNIFNEQLRKTGVEYFDYYLLHDVGYDHYKKYSELGCFEWLVEKKKADCEKHS